MTGVTLQLLAIVGSAGVTIAFVAYRFGQLETRVLLQLADHDARLKKLEATPLALHGIVS